jgi:F-type H+-transporting ATPase subunit b
MTINWWTLALQAVNFLVLVWLLWRFLYRPVKEVIEKRKALAEQAFADAEKSKSEAEAARQRYEEDRANLPRERQEMLNKLHEELEAERGKAMAAARRDAEKEMEDARAAIAKERDAALTELRGEVSGLAVELASRLLREVGTGAPDSLFLDVLDGQIEKLAEEDRTRLQRDLETDGARLTVVTASSLAPEQQARWRERLNDRLGTAEKMVFATDPEILGGAELRFPHTVIKFTWADQLDKARELLRRNDSAT